MKRKPLLLTAFLCSAVAVNAQYYAPNGIATYIGGSTSLVQLTAASSYGTTPQSGSIWSMTTVNFMTSFKLNFDASFDIPTPYVPGGAGMTVVFGNHLTSKSLNPGGMFLGYYADPSLSYNPDFANSVGVEIDTRNNFLTPPYAGDINTLTDHTMITSNAMFDAAHTLAPATNFVVPNIKDGLFHHYTIDWNFCHGTLQIFRDGLLVDQALITPTSIFSNPTAVRWGFTAGIGADGDYGNQYVQNAVVTPYGCSISGCGSPCPSLAPLVATSKIDGSPCEFDCTTNTNPSCWTPIQWDWTSTCGGGTTVYHHYITSVSDHQLLPVPYGWGATLQAVVTFSDGAGHFCTSAPAAHTASCNGGYAGYKLGTSISNVEMNNDLKLYPVPATDQISISSNSNEISDIKILDVSGKLMKEYSGLSGKEQHISISEYPVGLYILRVNNEVSRMINKQ